MSQSGLVKTASIVMVTILGFGAIAGEFMVPAANPVGSNAPDVQDAVGSAPAIPVPRGETVTRPAGAGYLGPSSTPPIDVRAPLSPYAVHAGTIDYVAAGAALRNQGYGNITVNWTGTLVAAYLVWDYMAESTPLNGTMNGVGVTGTVIASDVDTCEPPANTIYTLAADVTALVVKGRNRLTGFPSGTTTGDDPWNTPFLFPALGGASLVVIFDSGGPWRQVILYLGATTLWRANWTLTDTFPHAVSISPLAQTTFIVSNGQMYGNDAEWNSVVVDPNAFPGGDPRTSTALWSYGNLSDTRTYPVTAALGSTSEMAGISNTGNIGPASDCIAWHGQVLRVDTSRNRPPTLSWTGESNYGMDGLDPEMGTILTTFSYRVAYADADGDPPARIEVRVEKPLGTPWGAFPMVLVGWRGMPRSYADGAIFALNTTLPAGTEFWYSFNATDGWDWATGPPTTPIDAPDVVADNPPVAVAQASPTVAHMGDAITFDATGSTDDFGITAYQWDFDDGATDPNPVTTHAYASRGTFFATLTVWDIANQNDTDTVPISIENRQPIADAGPDQGVFKNDLVTLNGTGSHDPDGDPLTYVWNENTGPPVTLVGANTAAPTFKPSASGTYAFVLTIEDGWGGFSNDIVNVAVANRAPIANAGSDQTVPKKTRVTLDGTGSSDPDGDALTYAWMQTGGPAVVLLGANTPTPAFTPLTSSVYAFRLTVDDGDGGTSEDTATITVWGLPPIARLVATPPVASVGEPIAFDGSGSSDPDGVIVNFAFEFGDGGVANGTEAMRNHSYAIPGWYTATLTVTDDDGNVSPAIATVEIVAPPVSVTVNYKPIVAVIFAIILLVAGVWSSKKRPWKGGKDGVAVMKAFMLFSLPFILAEATTGVVSFLTGQLPMPPLVGAGTAVDLAILLAGTVVAILRIVRIKSSGAQETSTPQRQ